MPTSFLCNRRFIETIKQIGWVIAAKVCLNNAYKYIDMLIKKNLLIKLIFLVILHTNCSFLSFSQAVNYEKPKYKMLILITAEQAMVIIDIFANSVCLQLWSTIVFMVSNTIVDVRYPNYLGFIFDDSTLFLIFFLGNVSQSVENVILWNSDRISCSLSSEPCIPEL